MAEHPLVLIGHPVSQVQLPTLMRNWTGRDVMHAVDVPPTALRAQVTRFMNDPHLGGIVITVPHKQAAVGLATTLTPSARAANSVNALKRVESTWIGANFDGSGFVAGLEAAGTHPLGKTFFLNGMGGAGSAIAVELLLAGASELLVFDPDFKGTQARLDCFPPELRTSVRLLDQARTAQHVDVAINASPVGMMNDNRVSFDPQAIGTPPMLVCDIIMKPATTPLLERAAALGHPVHPGLPMLTHQRDGLLAFFDLSPSAPIHHGS